LDISPAVHGKVVSLHVRIGAMDLIPERALPFVLPLSKGEGWGEGEGIVRQPTVHEEAIRMCGWIWSFDPRLMENGYLWPAQACSPPPNRLSPTGAISTHLHSTHTH
jgi:hypothetical protein